MAILATSRSAHIQKIGVGQLDPALQQCRSHLLGLIRGSSSSRRSHSSGCRGGSLQLKIKGHRQRLRKTRLHLLPHPATGEPAGAETIAEAVAIEGLPQHTIPSLFSGLSSCSRSWWRRAILRGATFWSSTIVMRGSSLHFRTGCGGDHLQCRELHQRSDGEGPGHARTRGYHCSLFANYTLDGIMAVLLFTMSSRTGGSVGLLCEQGSRAPCFSAFHMACHSMAMRSFFTGSFRPLGSAALLRRGFDQDRQ